MKKFFKILIIILLIPVIFIGVLKLYYLIIPGKEIGIKGDWISFSGGYIGSIIALWGIWWQVSNEKKDKEIKEEQKYKNFKKYVERIIDFNLKELENSRENIIKTYTYHIRFLNRQEIYNFKEINEKTPIDLYWRFYDELMNVLTFSRLFPDTEEQNRYKEYREVYLDISRLRANDNNRKKLIEKYEEILKKCKKIY